MMEGVAMLRQLIGQLQEVLQLYGSPPPTVPSNYFLHFQAQSPHLTHQQPLRWCFLNLESSPLEGNCCNIVMTAGKSENLKMLEPGKPPPSKKARKERTRGKAITATTSSEPMEQDIWKEFPQDLFEAVIARLPIATFFRFRSVCRKWNSLLTSQSFSQQCAQVKRSQSWFYTITHENVNTGAMYDPSSKKWHHPTVPALPTKLIVLPVASAGGLICFLDIGHRSFYVCNPLTRSFKELPARSVKVWSRVAVGMSLNGASSGYKILWVGCDGEYEVFDSVKNSWARPGPMPSNIKLPLALNFRSQAVTVDGTLYFMRSDPDGVVSYEMESGRWREYVIPAPAAHVSDQTLAEWGGRIMLVGMLSKNAATCVCIWELEKMTMLWKEVDRMPNIWCLEFYGKHVRMTCLGNKGGMLMLSLRSRQMNRLVTYDLGSREWIKVPPCVLPNDACRNKKKKRQWIACGTAFNPSFTSPA